jgi:hypothetical protein
VECDPHIDPIRSVVRFEDGQRTPMEGLRFCVPTLLREINSEMVEARGNARVHGRQGFFLDRQQAPMHRLGLGRPIPPNIQVPESIKGIGHIRTVGPLDPLQSR